MTILSDQATQHKQHEQSHARIMYIGMAHSFVTGGSSLLGRK